MDYIILINIKLSEEPIELLHCWWAHTLSCQDFVEEVGCFNLVENVAVIDIVFAPNSIHLVFDKIFVFRSQDFLLFVHEIIIFSYC